MKTLNEIFSSITGNTKTRISDPLIGAFVVSWITCNWNHLAILIWGEGKPSERINTFHQFLSETPFFAFNSLFIIPALLTAFYLFLLPWISLLSKNVLEIANKKLHNQAVNTELDKITSQQHLEEARLRSNPDKPFLEKKLQLEIDRKNQIQEHLIQRTARFKANATVAKAEAGEAIARETEAKSKAKYAQHEESIKKNQLNIERKRFEAASARLNAANASNRFPSAYLYMSLISQSLDSENLYISLGGTAEIVAAIFGYENFHTLLADGNFNNEKLFDVEYIFYDLDTLVGNIQNIIADEDTSNENLTANTLFEHIQSVFQKLSIQLITLEEIEEKISDFFDEHKFDLLEHKELSGVMAISDTVFEEIEFDSMEIKQNDDGVSTTIQALARGSHAKYERARGQSMRISADIQSLALVGKNALGGISFGYVSGSIVDTYAEEDRGL